MKRFAISAIALALASMVVVAPAHAQRDMGRGSGFHGPMGGHVFFHNRFNNRVFFRDRFFFRNHFFFARNHFFFRPFFFFGSPVFAPVPVVLSPPTPFPAFFTAPATAAPGMVAPTAAGGGCYQFQTSIPTDDGQVQPAWGNACLQADGSWQIVG